MVMPLLNGFTGVRTMCFRSMRAPSTLLSIGLSFVAFFLPNGVLQKTIGAPSFTGLRALAANTFYPSANVGHVSPPRSGSSWRELKE